MKQTHDRSENGWNGASSVDRCQARPVPEQRLVVAQVRTLRFDDAEIRLATGAVERYRRPGGTFVDSRRR